ncbi:MAG: insulinase family protein [Caulobacteraceae bacterium]|nr:insulinase family protein [Caulobacteraceae bacterium]
MNQFSWRRAAWTWLGAVAGAASLLASAPAVVSAAAAPAGGNWSQDGGDLPADPAVRFGTLPNGMRYAIMRNATPQGEVSIRFRIDAGSLMETEAQAGLAHMVEHMSFRGTTHVPQAEEWKGLQRLGMAMGADVSAFTTESQTFYQFDLPNADPRTLDTGLMRMRETASEILMRPDALDAERGTVLSEERTRDTPSYRTSREELSFFYKGQPLAAHMPIGTVDNIEHAPAEALRAFYRAYYRPERATLIVVGDVDPDLVEAKIKARFDDWRAVGPAGPEPVLGPPLKRGMETRLVVDPKLSRLVAVGWVAPYDGGAETQAKVRRNVVESIALAIVSHRLQRMANQIDRPFLSAQLTSQAQARSAKLTLLSVDIDPAHWRSALITADVARRQALEFGVEQAEVDREVAAFRAEYQTGADGASTRPTPTLASGLLTSVDRRFVFTSPAENLDLVKQATEGLTAAQVRDALRGLFAGSGPLVFVTSPVAIDGGEDTVAAAFNAAETQTIEAPVKDEALVWPYGSFGEPGRVAEQHAIDDLGVTLVRFANGVRLAIKPTTFSADQVLVQVKFGQGLLELPKDRGTARWAADAGAYLLGGLKGISYDDMQQVLSSKVYGVSFGTREDGFTLSGGTTPSDLDTQLQVLAAYLTEPGWRKEAFDRVRAAAAPQLNNFAASPGGVMQRDIGLLLHNGDPRWAAVTPLDVAFARVADMRAVLDRPLAEGPIEITVVGAVTPERAIAAVAATFGALPPRPDPSPPPADATQVRFPAPPASPVIRHHKGRPDQAMAVIAWPSADFYSDPQRSRDLRILEQIIQARLFEQLRIADGASYVPETSLETSTVFPGYGYIYAAAEVPPDKLDLFFRIARGIAADLRAREVSHDELDRARAPRVDLFTKSQQNNGYWLTVLSGVQADPRKLDVIRTTIPDLKRVTAAGVHRAARTFLLDERAWTMEVLPQPAADPSAAKPAPLTGSVTVNCALNAGKLSDCRVIKEEPPGRGLGGEAIAITGQLAADPSKTAKASDGRVQFAIHLPYPDPAN